MRVRRAYVWGRFKEAKSKASNPCSHASAAGRLAWREKTTYSAEGLFVFPSTRLKGAKPLSASILVQKYLRPAAVKAGVIREGQKIRFGFHNFRHSLASALVRMKVDPKTVQEFLRQAHVATHSSFTRSRTWSRSGPPRAGIWNSCSATGCTCSRSEFSDYLGWSLGGRIFGKSCKCFEMWWPGTELNRRRQPFQG
jgi:Phage integrase family